MPPKPPPIPADATKTEGQPDFAAMFKAAMTEVATGLAQQQAQSNAALLQGIQQIVAAGRQAPPPKAEPKRFNIPGVNFEDDGEPYGQSFGAVRNGFEDIYQRNAALEQEIKQAREHLTRMGTDFYAMQRRQMQDAALVEAGVPPVFHGHLRTVHDALAQQGHSADIKDVIESFVPNLAQHIEAAWEKRQGELAKPKPLQLLGTPTEGDEQPIAETMEEADANAAQLLQRMLGQNAELH